MPSEIPIPPPRENSSALGEEGGTPNQQNEAWKKAQQALQKVKIPPKPVGATPEDNFNNNLLKLYPWMNTVGNPYSVFSRPPVATPSWNPTPPPNSWGASSYAGGYGRPPRPPLFNQSYNNESIPGQYTSTSVSGVRAPFTPRVPLYNRPPANPPQPSLAENGSSQPSGVSFRFQGHHFNGNSMRGQGRGKVGTGGNTEPLGPGVKMRTFGANKPTPFSSDDNASDISPTNDNKVSGSNNTMPPGMQAYIERAYLAAETESDKNKVQTALKMKLMPLLHSGQAWKVVWEKEALPTDPTFLIGGWTPVKELRKQQNQQSNTRGRGRGGAMSRWNQPRSRSRSRESRNSNSRKFGKRKSPSGSSDRSFRRGGRSSSRSSRSSSSEQPVISKKLKKAAKLAKKAAKRQSKHSSKSSIRMQLSGDVMQQARQRIKRAQRFAPHLTNSKPKVVASRLRPPTEQMDDDYSWSIDKRENSDSELDLSAEFNVVGTCQDIEKPFFRLTAAPDPSQVRPESVLQKALALVKRRWKADGDYHWTCDQLRSIRQDLTVQRIRNAFTVESYEAHARIALEKGDREEFNQCQTQLKNLYIENPGCENEYEFTAYRLIYYLSMNNLMDINSFMAELSPEARKSAIIGYALKVRQSWALGMYSNLFKLYLDAPHMASYVMDLFVDRHRKNSLQIMIKAFRPSLPVEYVKEQLGFGDDLLACIEWLKKIEINLTENNSKIDCRQTIK